MNNRNFFLLFIISILLVSNTSSTELAFLEDYCISGQDCTLNDLFLTGNFSFVGAIINLTIINQNVIGQMTIGGSLNVNGNVTADFFSGDGSLLTNIPNSSLWNRSGTNTFLRNIGDNVGIGITIPTSKLHVSVATTGDPGITLGVDPDSTLDYTITRDGGGGHLFFQGSQAGATGYRFLSDDDSVLLAIIDNGNVGIGTISPDVPLEIEANAQSLLHLDSQSTQEVLINFGNNNAGHTLTDGSKIGLTSLEGFQIWNFENQDMIFATNNDVKVRLSASGGLAFGSVYEATDPGSNNFIIEGNVGIGTTAPKEGLHLNSSTFLQTPGNPVKVGGVTLGNTGRAIYVSGKYAYVGLQKSGAREFEIVDISDPTNPTKVGSGVEFGANVNGIYVSGKYAYAVTDGNRLEVIDISNPASPIRLDNIVTADVANAVYVSGKYAYVGSAVSGDDLEIFDISDPTSLTKAGGVGAADGVNAIYVQGKYAYVGSNTTNASGNDNLEIFDISDPTNPSKVGGANATGVVNAVYVSGRYAYVGSNETGDDLEIFDIKDPTSPTKVGGVAAADDVNAVYVSGKYAYVGSDATGDDLEVFDISDPASPSKVAGVDASAISAIYISGKYAYVGAAGSGNHISIFDIGGIDAPSANIGDLAASTIDVTENLQVANDAYVGNGLVVGSGGIYSQGGLSAANLSGTGNDFVCVDSNGKLFRSDASC